MRHKLHCFDESPTCPGKEHAVILTGKKMSARKEHAHAWKMCCDRQTVIKTQTGRKTIK
jgi:hypothetical protein